MPTTNAVGHSIPAPADAADPALWLDRFSLSAPPVITVASLTEANTRRAQYLTEAAAAGVPPQRLMVWRTDVNQLFRDTGTGWEYLAGRQHGALVNVARPALMSGGTPWLLYVTGIVKASPGWTVVNNRLVTPAPGLYAAEVVVNVDANSGLLGRVFGQVAINGNPQQKRFATAIDENNYSGMVTLDVAAGAQIQPTHYHATGGARDVTGTMLVYTAANPAW